MKKTVLKDGRFRTYVNFLAVNQSFENKFPQKNMPTITKCWIWIQWWIPSYAETTWAIWAKKKNLLLSIESWCFNKDSNFMALYIPHQTG